MATLNEDYVSFEIAKLLKEKGFDIPCDYAYNNKAGYFEVDRSNFDEVYCFRPSLAMAMKWLREVHKLWIGFSVFCPAPENMTKHADCVPKYFYNIKRYEIGYMDILTEREYELNFATYKECVEAAIKYCLENLI